jgi:hypothetical protein
MPVRVPRVSLVPLILTPPHREGVTDVAPWLRPLHVAGLLLILLAGPAHASYATPYAPSYEPVPGESRAGSRAGEGRERPGREARPTEEDIAAGRHPDSPESPGLPDRSEAAVVPEPPRSSAPEPFPPAGDEQASTRSVHGSEPVFRVLPLGSGLVLIGLGLAFVALRVRRG